MPTSVSHENHLIFMRMTVQVTYIFIPIVSLKDSFCQSGKSKLGIGLFIHELLREPLILNSCKENVVLHHLWPGLKFSWPLDGICFQKLHVKRNSN